MDIKVLEDKFTVVDLSHSIDEKIPIWPGELGFSREIAKDYEDWGYRGLIYTMGACLGTHMDAPLHFDKDGMSLSEIPLSNLIVSCYCIDVSSKCSDDLLIEEKDIVDFEKQHGTIKAKSIVVVCTGWDKRWENTKDYINQDSNLKMHFPGFSLEAAKLLLKREVVGIDALSPDGSEKNGFDVHELFLKNEKYFIENLTNLQKLPPTGSYIIALPLKIIKGTEISIRAIGLIPYKLKT